MNERCWNCGDYHDGPCSDNDIGWFFLVFGICTVALLGLAVAAIIYNNMN